MSEELIKYNGESVFPKEELKRYIDLYISDGQARKILKDIECPKKYSYARVNYNEKEMGK